MQSENQFGVLYKIFLVGRRMYASEKKYDVLVVGGGSAGTMASLASANGGAETCLIEKCGHLGGTTFALGNVVSFYNNRMERVVGGLAQRFVDRMIKSGGALDSAHVPNPGGMCGTVTLLDSSILKYVMLEMMEQAEVRLLLHSNVTDVLVEGGRIRGVVVVNKEGRHRLLAESIIDCSGDGDVAVGAGAKYQVDPPGTALSATLIFRVGGINHSEFIYDLRRNPQSVILLEDPYLKEAKGLSEKEILESQVKSIYDLPYIYLANLVRDYIPRRDWTEWGIRGTEREKWGELAPFGSRVHLTPSAARPDVFYVNTTNVHLDPFKEADVTRGEVDAQRQIFLMLEVLRKYVPGFENSWLLDSMPSISIRASRRILCDYEMNREDVEEGRRFSDGIARGCYPMSVQSVEEPNVRLHLYVKDGGDYDIPYRCLLPQGVEGLVVAGRCISATREASGSLRTGAQCMAYGHAAGTAVSLSVRERTTPRKLNIKVLRNVLKDQGAVL
jgi:hypothetical protein